MKNLACCERGVLAVELAVILPVLLLFLFGLMEGSRILSAWVILTNEAREAARYGAVNDSFVDCSSGTLATWASNVTSFATSSVGQTLNTSSLTVTPTLDCSTGIPTSSKVQLTYTMSTFTPLVQAVLPTVTIGTTSVMRAE
jgi:Flp pilus assembly protein TadG